MTRSIPHAVGSASPGADDVVPDDLDPDDLDPDDAFGHRVLRDPSVDDGPWADGDDDDVDV